MYPFWGCDGVCSVGVDSVEVGIRMAVTEFPDELRFVSKFSDVVNSNFFAIKMDGELLVNQREAEEQCYRTSQELWRCVVWSQALEHECSS